MPENTPNQIAYAATGGRSCPACEGTDIASGNDTTFTNCTILRVLLCEDCGAGWKAVYTLSGYEDLRLPLTTEEMPDASNV
jgi:C4-type Zn-finger protein